MIGAERGHPPGVGGAGQRSPEECLLPYSGFAVGRRPALCGRFRVCWCNIENAGFTATCCAERTAFFRAVNDGKRAFKAIAIVGCKAGQEPQELCAPCGVCRQVMAEFCAPGFEILLTDGKTLQVTTLEELLPWPLGPKYLGTVTGKGVFPMSKIPALHGSPEGRRTLLLREGKGPMPPRCSPT